MGGPRVGDEGRKDAKESTERIERRRKAGWKTQRKMDRQADAVENVDNSTLKCKNLDNVGRG